MTSSKPVTLPFGRQLPSGEWLVLPPRLSTVLIISMKHQGSLPEVIRKNVYWISQNHGENPVPPASVPILLSTQRSATFEAAWEFFCGVEQAASSGH